MRNSLTISVYLICIVFFNTAVGQHQRKKEKANATKQDTKTFKIASLDGQGVSVKISPDHVHHVLIMSCLKDTIRVEDFWGVPPQIRLLNKNFIEISYAIRGGSNLGLGNTLILCANGGKLHEAMHVLGYTNWDDGDVKAGYAIKVALKGSDKSNYKLYVDVRDKVYSKKSITTIAIKPF